jgi:DNA-binding NarL/FixJ family response regulator
MPTRVLLADDHILFAEALTRMLAERYEIVDVVGDGKALQDAARKHKPDVIVADVTMPLMSGLESIGSISKDPFVPRMVVLTMHADPELARECLKNGAMGFVTKDCAFEELILAIESVIAQHVYISSNVAAGLIDGLKEPDPTANPKLEPLTSRQREILQLFAEGKTMKEIASATNLSTRTVEWHKYRMMRMLGVRRSAELVHHAVRMKLVI